MLKFLPALSLLLPLAFVWVDRWWGAPNRKRDAKVIAVLAIVVGYLAAPRVSGAGFWDEWYGAVLMLGMTAGRSLGFGENEATVVDSKSLRGATLRASWPVLWGVAIVLLGAKDVPLAVLTFLALSAHAAATVRLAVLYGHLKLESQRLGKDTPSGYNAELERTRGFVGGCAAAVIFAGGALMRAEGVAQHIDLLALVAK